MIRLLAGAIALSLSSAAQAEPPPEVPELDYIHICLETRNGHVQKRFTMRGSGKTHNLTIVRAGTQYCSLTAESRGEYVVHCGHVPTETFGAGGHLWYTEKMTADLKMVSSAGFDIEYWIGHREDHECFLND